MNWNLVVNLLMCIMGCMTIGIVYVGVKEIRKFNNLQNRRQELFNKIYEAQSAQQLSKYKLEAYKLLTENIKKKYVESYTTHSLLGALVERGETLSMELRMNMVLELNNLQQALDEAVRKTGNSPKNYAQYDTIKLLEKLLNDVTTKD